MSVTIFYWTLLPMQMDMYNIVIFMQDNKKISMIKILPSDKLIVNLAVLTFIPLS